jgi:hypothetical protein
MLVQFELDQVLEAEGRLVIRDFAINVVLESLPVAIFHELRVQFFDERHHLRHVLDALVQ